MSEVVFWDILIFLEATKTYVKLMKGKNIDEEMVRKLKDVNIVGSKNPHFKSKDTEKNKASEKETGPTPELFGGSGGDEKIHKKFNKNFITTFVRKIAFNEKIAKFVPRLILYPLVRYALYLEYLMQKILFKDSNNIHNWTNSKVTDKIRITQADVDTKSTSQIDRSLRSIVKKKFYHNQKHPAVNPGERLIGGP